MIICPACKTELKCMKNGIGVRYGTTGEHVYYGDKYRCLKCYFEIINCNNNSIYDENLSRLAEYDVFMDTTEQDAKEVIYERNNQLIKE